MLFAQQQPVNDQICDLSPLVIGALKLYCLPKSPSPQDLCCGATTAATRNARFVPLQPFKLQQHQSMFVTSPLFVMVLQGRLTVTESQRMIEWDVDLQKRYDR